MTRSPVLFARRLQRWRTLVPALLLVACWTASPAIAQDPGEPVDPAPRAAATEAIRYDLRATLSADAAEPDRHVLRGECRSVVWENRSDESVEFVWFRLPANALRRGSLAHVERLLADLDRPADDDFTGLDVDLVRDGERRELEAEYVGVGDAAPNDRTRLRVRLAEPVEPGETVTLALRFVHRVPRLSAFGGSTEDFVLAVGWYPRLAEYVGRSEAPLTDGFDIEPTRLAMLGGWPEGPFARIDAWLTVPEGFEIPTVPAAAEEGEDTATTFHWSLERARSVPWVAARGLEPVERTARLLPEPSEEQPRAPLSAYAHELAAERERLQRHGLATDERGALRPLSVEVFRRPDSEVTPERWFDAVEYAVGTFGLLADLPPCERMVVVEAPSMRGPIVYASEQLLVCSPVREEGFGFERRLLHHVGRRLTAHLATGRQRDEWLRDGVVRWIAARGAARTDWRPGVEWRGFGETIPVAPFFDFPRLGPTWQAAVDLPEWARPPRIELLELWRDLPGMNGATIVERPHPLDSLRADVVGAPRSFALAAAPWGAAGPELPRTRSARAALTLDALRHAYVLREGHDAGQTRFLRLLAALGATDGRAALPPAEHLKGLLDEPAAGLLDGLLAEATPDVRIARVVALPPSSETAGHRTRIVLRREGEAALPVRLEVTGDRIPMRLGADAEANWTPYDWDGAGREQAFDFDGPVRQARLITPRVDHDSGNDSYRSEADPRPAAKWSVRFLLWLENALLSYGRFL